MLNCFLEMKYNTTVEKYRLEIKGKTSCSLGYMIRGTVECKDACSRLGIVNVSRTMKDGKACFKGGNGKCRQDGSHGSEAFLICRNDTGM